MRFHLALFGVFLAASVSALSSVDPRVVSAWLSADGNEVLLFRYDGVYYQANIGGAAKGFERGGFSWDASSGSLSATTKVDTNGTAGLSHPGGNVSVTITGNSMTRVIGGSSVSFSRVTNSAGSIVGAWFHPDEPGFVLFLGTGTYVEVDEDDDIPSNHDGFEIGNYTWNSGTGAISATAIIKTNLEGGPASIPAGSALVVAGNRLTVTVPGDDADVLHRLTTSASPIRLPDFQVLKSAEYLETSGSGPSPVPYAPGDENAPFQGTAAIFEGVPAVSPTLKIGSRSAAPFGVDEDDGYFFIEGLYSSKALLDAASAFPDNTTYLFAAGSGNSASLTMPAGGTFPSVPAFIRSPDEDDQGTWIAVDSVELNGLAEGLYRMDGQTLRWTPQSGFNPAVHATALAVEDLVTGDTIIDQLIQGDISFFELEGLLVPGRRYEVALSLVKIDASTTSGTGVFSGKQGHALHITTNTFYIESRAVGGKPSIYGHPADVSAQIGSKVSLDVGVSNSREATIRWYKNGVEIPGQTGNSLTFLQLAETDYGKYFAQVSGGGVVKYSNTASIAPPRPYDLYASGIGLDPVNVDFSDLDYDKDGSSNYLEFVLAGDPKVPQGNLVPQPVITPSGGNAHQIAFRYNRRTAAGAEIQVVEYSSDLINWSPAVSGQGGVTASSTAPVAGIETRTVTIPVNGPKYFARLRVGPEIVINNETSYKNFKEIGLSAMPLTSDPAPGNARGYGNFFGDGSLGLFAAALTYEVGGASVPATFGFWKRQPNGTFVKDPSMITSGVGSIHPRKALVADFNRDGRPDVFVVSHGYDADPFPGERNKIVLSQPNGRYVIQDAAPETGFFHGGAAADVDKDGDIDVITLGGGLSLPATFLNEGNGTFVQEASGRLPTALNGNQYYSIELADVDGDGRPDLIAGGHEWDAAPTVVYSNPGNFRFRGGSPVIIPPVANEGVVLDFLVTGTGPSRALWVLRSSGGDSTFYQGRTLQKVTWPGLQSSTPLKTRAQGWVDWMIPATSGGQPVIVCDDITKNLSVSQ